MIKKVRRVMVKNRVMKATNLTTILATSAIFQIILIILISDQRAINTNLKVMNSTHGVPATNPILSMKDHMR